MLALVNGGLSAGTSARLADSPRFAQASRCARPKQRRGSGLAQRAPMSRSVPAYRLVDAAVEKAGVGRGGTGVAIARAAGVAVGRGARVGVGIVTFSDAGTFMYRVSSWAMMAKAGLAISEPHGSSVGLSILTSTTNWGSCAGTMPTNEAIVRSLSY